MNEIFIIILSILGGICLNYAITKIKKLKDFFLKLRVKISRNIYWLLISSFAILFGLINSKGETLGSWADWASAIMSFVAILVVFWQVQKESQNKRAFYIENKRPRFSVERTTIINLDEKILYQKSFGNLKTLYKELHGNKSKYIIRLTNTSDNTVYSLKIIINYIGDKTKNEYAFDSLYSRQSILLVTDERIPSGSFIDLWIKFKTVANEIGYFHFKVSLVDSSAEYTFVKNKEPVSVYGDDILINKNSSEAEKLEKKFNGEKYSYNIVTISEEEFNDLKR